MCFFNYHIKQTNSKFLWSCTVKDCRRGENTVRTSLTHSPVPHVPLFCSYCTLTSSVVFYWTDAQQHGTYSLGEDYLSWEARQCTLKNIYLICKCNPLLHFCNIFLWMESVCIHIRARQLSKKIINFMKELKEYPDSPRKSLWISTNQFSSAIICYVFLHPGVS